MNLMRADFLNMLLRYTALSVSMKAPPAYSFLLVFSQSEGRWLKMKTVDALAAPKPSIRSKGIILKNKSYKAASKVQL